MTHSRHGKDGRFRDSTGLISFEYDRNDPRHIQQELDHPQLGHEGQYRNCWICHDYTPRRFRTQREVDADNDPDSQPRYPVLLREDVATVMDRMSMQRLRPPGYNWESNQRGSDYRADAVLPITTRETTYLRKSKRSSGEPIPEGKVASDASSVIESRETQRKSAPHSRETNPRGSDAHEVVRDSCIDDVIGQILGNKAKIHEALATYHKSDGSHDAVVVLPRLLEKGFERQLKEMSVELEDPVGGRM